MEDGEDSKSSSPATFTPHDQLSHLQPEEIQLAHQTLSYRLLVAFACSCAVKEDNLLHSTYSSYSL